MNEIAELSECVIKLNTIDAKYDINKQRLFSEWAKCAMNGYTPNVSIFAPELVCATIRADKQNDT